MNRQEQIRKELLLQLYASRPMSLSIERMRRDAFKQGYDFGRLEISREAQFLVDEGVVVPLQPKGSCETLFRITSEGVRQYEQIFSL